MYPNPGMGTTNPLSSTLNALSLGSSFAQGVFGLMGDVLGLVEMFG
ncbi:hypothetical protein [Nocardia sp. NBC_00511]